MHVRMKILLIFFLLFRLIDIDMFFSFFLFLFFSLPSDDDKYWWFESAILIQKALLTGGLVLVAPGSSIQILVGLVLAFMFTLLLMQSKPYREYDEDQLQTISTVSTVATLLIGFTLKVDQNKETEGQGSEYDKSILDTILVLLFGGVALAGLFMTIKSLPCYSYLSCEKEDDDEEEEEEDEEKREDQEEEKEVPKDTQNLPA